MAIPAGDEGAAGQDPRGDRPSSGGTTGIGRGRRPEPGPAGLGGKFSTIDSYVHERLAIFDNRKRGIPGRWWGKRHDGAWFTRLGVFRLSGNVRWVAVHASR